MMKRSWLFILVGVCLTAGCAESDVPQFKLNVVAYEQAEVPREQYQAAANILTAMFGTPDDPYVLPETGLNINKIRIAAGPVWSDEQGVNRGLFRRHCVHCHGITGDGMGPTAAILNPYPRDYRPGKYKYKSTARAAMPTNADFERIMRHGVMGTSMPSFDLLSQIEIDALIEYVKYLTLRGQVELNMVYAILDLGEGEQLELSRDVLVDTLLQPAVDQWAEAEDSIIAPPPPPEMPLEESIALGRELFYGEKANCVKCHGPTALGDGVLTDYDDWNKPLGEKADQLKGLRAQLAAARAGDATVEEIADLQNELTAGEQAWLQMQSLMLPLRPIVPRNLRLGIYRFGRRPLDLYRRVHEGINGAPMPGVGTVLSPDEMWHVVNYVRSLPYELPRRPPAEPKVAVAPQ
jgi:mono/diheme cytochrome c family protein